MSFFPLPDITLVGYTPGNATSESVELTPFYTLANSRAYTIMVRVTAQGIISPSTKALQSYVQRFSVRRDSGVTTIAAADTQDQIGDAGASSWTMVVSVGSSPDRLAVTFTTGSTKAAVYVRADFFITKSTNPAKPLPPLAVSAVDIISAVAPPTVQYAEFGGIYQGLTIGGSFTATANGYSCSGVRFYRGDTHPVQVTLWQAPSTQLATATGTGTGTAQTILFSSPVALTPGVIYCVTVFDTTAPTSNFSLAPTYWNNSGGTSWERALPQGVGNACVQWGQGWMGVDFLGGLTGTATSYRNWYFNSGYGYGCPNMNASLGDMPVDPVVIK